MNVSRSVPPDCYLEDLERPGIQPPSPFRGASPVRRASSCRTIIIRDPDVQSPCGIRSVLARNQSENYWRLCHPNIQMKWFIIVKNQMQLRMVLQSNIKFIQWNYMKCQLKPQCKGTNFNEAKKCWTITELHNSFLVFGSLHHTLHSTSQIMSVKNVSAIFSSNWWKSCIFLGIFEKLVKSIVSFWYRTCQLVQY